MPHEELPLTTPVGFKSVWDRRFSALLLSPFHYGFISRKFRLNLGEKEMNQKRGSWNDIGLSLQTQCCQVHDMQLLQECLIFVRRSHHVFVTPVLLYLVLISEYFTTFSQWQSPLHSGVSHYLNVTWDISPAHAHRLTAVIGEGFADIKGNSFCPKHTWKSASV